MHQGRPQTIPSLWDSTTRIRDQRTRTTGQSWSSRVYQNRRCQIIFDLNMRRHEPQFRGLCGQLISRLLDLVNFELFKMPLWGTLTEVYSYFKPHFWALIVVQAKLNHFKSQYSWLIRYWTRKFVIITFWACDETGSGQRFAEFLCNLQIMLAVWSFATSKLHSMKIVFTLSKSCLKWDIRLCRTKILFVF